MAVQLMQRCTFILGLTTITITRNSCSLDLRFYFFKPCPGKAEYVIEDVAGCGPFQVILSLTLIFVGKAATAYTTLFMTFGNYNPGWRCLDNVTSNSTNSTRNNFINLEYTEGSCDDYKKCHNVEFNRETSTVVTEWGLLCDKEWLGSIIISLQMVGMLIGSLVGGQLSDLFGRKIILFSSIFACAVLHLLSSFSVSLPMFFVLKFALGIFCTCVLILLFIYTAEFMTVNWRAPLMNVPLWYLGAIMQALIVMGFKDWRNVERVGCAIYVILFIPVFWVPESLRWLEVKGKKKKFHKVAQKITKLNVKTVSSFEEFEITKCNGNAHDDKKYSVLDLFRPGYKLFTFIVGFLNFIFSLFYYALSFGVKSFYGDFYINMIIYNVISIPFSCITMLSVRYGRRLPTGMVFSGSSVALSFAAVGCLLSGSDGAKATGSTILISLAKGMADGAWGVIFVRVTEIYPTVIRSSALGFASLSARVGAILAPFVIPSDKRYLFIFIIVSAIVMLFSCFLNYKLPETKDTQLKETFDDETNQELKNMNTDDLTKGLESE